MLLKSLARTLAVCAAVSIASPPVLASGGGGETVATAIGIGSLCAGLLVGAASAIWKVRVASALRIAALGLVACITLTVGAVVTPWYLGLVLALVCCVPLGLGLVCGHYLTGAFMRFLAGRS